MKIAMVVPGGVDRSGERRVIPALLALLGRLAAEHEVHVLATHQEPAPGRWRLEGACIHNLGRPRTAWRAARLIAAEHRRGRFDVIHSIWSGGCGALAVAMATLLRVPAVVHVAGGELVALDDIGYGGCRSWRGRLRERVVLRRAARVTAASAPIVELVAERGVAAERLPLGVDLRRWPPREPWRRSSGEPARLVHVASLNPVKDQPTLLRALRMLADQGRDFVLDVAGEDTLGGRIQRMAADLGLAGRVRFHGFLPQRALRPLVERAHVALVSSRHEAGPVAVLEAAAVGVPTVGTAVGHVAEWHGHAALAVPCRNPAALAQAIEAVLADEALRLRLAHAARERAEREDADATARAFTAIYERLRRRPDLAGEDRSRHARWTS
ncbi:MAG TPA: glycosyltransferase family 4 protein [Gammaproteobacteria bacterium]